MSAVVLGDFDAEASWRDPELSRLPALHDPAARRMVQAMDELLFPLCEPSDSLLTHQPLSEELRDQLALLGVAPRYGSLPGAQARPFAVTSELQERCRALGLRLEAPPLVVVRRVNSKTFSTGLRDRLGLWNPARVARSAVEVQELGRELLPCLVKDPFGVSGAGNLVLDHPDLLDRIVRYLERQEAKGRRTELVIEPLLPRTADFSCQLELRSDEEPQLRAVRRLDNDGMAYGGTRADPAFAARLAAEGVLSTMMEVGRALSAEGYYGPVCVDGMLLEGGRFFPLVEINARVSMGLLGHLLEERLQLVGLPCRIAQRTLVCSGAQPFARLHDALGPWLLREPGGAGLLPLAAGPLAVKQRTEASYRGRLHYLVTAHDEPGLRALETRLSAALHALAWKEV
jgi:hypothetical protein